MQFSLHFCVLIFQRRVKFSTHKKFSIDSSLAIINGVLLIICVFGWLLLLRAKKRRACSCSSKIAMLFPIWIFHEKAPFDERYPSNKSAWFSVVSGKANGSQLMRNASLLQSSLATEPITIIFFFPCLLCESICNLIKFFNWKLFSSIYV